MAIIVNRTLCNDDNNIESFPDCLDRALICWAAIIIFDLNSMRLIKSINNISNWLFIMGWHRY